ncbi:hypothetical protein DFR49_3896 [Hephaestia caeni]|uniref:Hemolysin n=1 Tax=Hephaestia caeni TaxID=645617 RepID=A0A397NLZ6_9SPHN|nr:DUF333 domain-containing protein [Hephaestia caeni]RIA36613.1 hypothetical protein DFR49_3896 [Hephaestia caeni]
MMKMRGLFLAGCLVAIGGCSAPDATEAPPKTGIANPASEFCVQQGGRVEIRDGANGQTGFCHLPDGKVIEEWEYFRANQPPAES